MLQKLKNISTLELLSIGYLVFPVLIYFFTFTKWIFSLLAIIALIILAYASINFKRKNSKNEFNLFSSKKSIIIFIVTLLIICLWLFLTGVGNFTYQQTDYLKHNTVLKDLIANDWPFAYNSSSLNRPFVYYFAYYIPAALVGKFAGYASANITFYIWTFIGVTLGFSWIFKFLKRVSLCPVIVLICFGGLDFLGHIITNGAVPPIGTHLEWWASILQFPSITACLNFVPHMFVLNIIIMPMLLCKLRSCECSFGLYTCIAAMPLWSPFILLGTIPFFIYYIIKLIINKEKLINIFNPFIVIPCLYLAIIPTLFLLSNTQAMGNFSGWIWEFDESGNIAWLLPLVLILEFAIPLTLIFANKKSLSTNSSLHNFSLIYVCIAMFAICSLIHIGLWNDFCMRVSMPSSLIVAIYFSECFHILFSKYKENKEILGFVWAVVLLLIMAFTPFNEFALKAIEKPSPIEEYSSPNLTKYLYPYQYMSSTDNNYYQHYISKELHYFNADTPGTGIDFTNRQIQQN